MPNEIEGFLGSGDLCLFISDKLNAISPLIKLFSFFCSPMVNLLRMSNPWDFTLILPSLCLPTVNSSSKLANGCPIHLPPPPPYRRTRQLDVYDAPTLLLVQLLSVCVLECMSGESERMMMMRSVYCWCACVTRRHPSDIQEHL